MGDNTDTLLLALRFEQLISITIGTLTVSTLLQAVRMVGAGQTPTMASALSAGMRTWGKIFVATITSGFAIFVAALCFVIPGIIRSSHYALVLPAVVDGLSGKEARAHSSNLVKELGTLTMLLWVIALAVSWYALPMLANLVLGIVEGLVPGLIVAAVTDALGGAGINVVAAGLTVFSAVVYGELSGKSEVSPVGLELSAGHAAPRTSGARTLAAVAIVGMLALLTTVAALALMVWSAADPDAAVAFLREHPAIGDFLAHVAGSE